MRAKKSNEIKYSITVYRDAKGRFQKKPSGKTLPKGWTRKKETRLKKDITAHKKWIKQLQKEESQFEKAVKKSTRKISYEKLKTKTARHLRFNRPGEKEFRKISPSWKPRKNTFYIIAIYEGNKRVGYWRMKKKQKWNQDLEEGMHREMESIRFPARKKVQFDFVGDTLRDALSVIRVEGLHHNCKVFLNLAFTAIRGPQPEFKRMRGRNVLMNKIEFNQNITVVLNRTFGESYDQILEDKVYEYLREWCAEHNVRYTSQEVLEEFYDNDMISIDTYAEKLERDWMTSVNGTVYAHIV